MAAEGVLPHCAESVCYSLYSVKVWRSGAVYTLCCCFVLCGMAFPPLPKSEFYGLCPQLRRRTYGNWS